LASFVARILSNVAAALSAMTFAAAAACSAVCIGTDDTKASDAAEQRAAQAEQRARAQAHTTKLRDNETARLGPHELYRAKTGFDVQRYRPTHPLINTV